MSLIEQSGEYQINWDLGKDEEIEANKRLDNEEEH